MSAEQQTPVAVEEVAKVQEEKAPVEQETAAAAAVEQTTPVEPEVTKDETPTPVEGDKIVEPTDNDNKTADVSATDEKSVDVAVVEPAAETVEAVESNGKGHSEPALDNNGQSEETVDQQPKETEVETNGVCKRKAENGTEAVDAGDKTENSPKKVKVVNDGEQAPVEETAA